MNDRYIGKVIDLFADLDKFGVRGDLISLIADEQRTQQLAILMVPGLELMVQMLQLMKRLLVSKIKHFKHAIHIIKTPLIQKQPHLIPSPIPLQ